MEELYENFVFFNGMQINFRNRSDDTIAEKLQIAAGECIADVNAFNFDPKCTDWEDYIKNITFLAF
ncbi:Fatty acyl-CoA reductase [Theobroma cacao]|nr:Fatty acyl-CoA reductase [Theobroma cacao]